MLKVRFLTITSMTLGCLLLGDFFTLSLEAIPTTPSSGTAGSTSGASTNGFSIFAPSRGTAGSTSGAGTTGSSILGGLIQVRENLIVTPAIQTSLNNIARQVIDNLTKAGGSSFTIANLTTLAFSNLSLPSASTILSTIAINVQGTIDSTPIPLPDGGSLVVKDNNSAAITINGTVTNISISGTANPQGAITTAAAVLGSGGNPTQALIAATLAGTSQSVNQILVIVLIDSLTGLVPNNQSSLSKASLITSFSNSTNVNLLSDAKLLREKTVKSSIPLLTAQERVTSVNIEKLNKAILAYNNLIDASSTEALQALSKNKEFIIIGNSLRELRAAIEI